MKFSKLKASKWTFEPISGQNDKMLTYEKCASAEICILWYWQISKKRYSTYFYFSGHASKFRVKIDFKTALESFNSVSGHLRTVINSLGFISGFQLRLFMLCLYKCTMTDEDEKEEIQRRKRSDNVKPFIDLQNA